MRTNADFPKAAPKPGQTVRLLYPRDGGTELLDVVIMGRSFHSDNYDRFSFLLPEAVKDNLTGLEFDLREGWKGYCKGMQGQTKVVPIAEIKIIE